MNFTDGVIMKANENFVICEADYLGEDGLLHCGKCHDAKQCRLSMNGKEIIVPCICSCEQKRIEREEQERRDRERLFYVRENKMYGLPNLNMQTWNFDNDTDPQSEVSQICRNYVIRFEELKKEKKNGLLFCGTVGAGKTYYAACIANALLEKGYKVLMRSISTLTSEIGYYSDNRLGCREYLAKWDLLIIDDLGVQRSTEYMNELVFTVIDERISSGKPMIITTNLKPKQMEKPESLEYQQIFSRIRGATTKITVVSDKDKRFQPSDRVNDLLGI